MDAKPIVSSQCRWGWPCSCRGSAQKLHDRTALASRLELLISNSVKFHAADTSMIHLEIVICICLKTWDACYWSHHLLGWKKPQRPSSGTSVVSNMSITLSSFLPQGSSSSASTKTADWRTSLSTPSLKHWHALPRLISSKADFIPYTPLKLFQWVLIAPVERSLSPFVTGITCRLPAGLVSCKLTMIKNPGFLLVKPGLEPGIDLLALTVSFLTIPCNWKDRLLLLNPEPVISRPWSLSWLPSDFLLQHHHCLLEKCEGRQQTSLRNGSSLCIRPSVHFRREPPGTMTHLFFSLWKEFNFPLFSFFEPHTHPTPPQYFQISFSILDKHESTVSKIWKIRAVPKHW